MLDRLLRWMKLSGLPPDAGTLDDEMLCNPRGGKRGKGGTGRERRGKGQSQEITSPFHSAVRKSRHGRI